MVEVTIYFKGTKTGIKFPKAHSSYVEDGLLCVKTQKGTFSYPLKDIRMRHEIKIEVIQTPPEVNPRTMDFLQSIGAPLAQFKSNVVKGNGADLAYPRC